MINVEKCEHARVIWQQTKDVNAALAYLRNAGVSKLDSIKVVRHICGVSLGEAKRMVGNSPVWADSLSGSQELHQALLDGLSDDE